MRPSGANDLDSWPTRPAPSGGVAGAAEIRDLAADELATLAAQRWGIGLADPVDVWGRSAGVTILRRTLAEDGRYIPGARPVVALNDALAAERERFTLAHELGHHLLERLRTSADFHGSISNRTVKYLSSVAPRNDEEELFCDMFAGSLLMPSETVCDLTGADARLTAQSLSDLARRFALPLGVAFSRLRRHSFDRRTLLVLYPARKQAEPAHHTCSYVSLCLGGSPPGLGRTAFVRQGEPVASIGHVDNDANKAIWLEIVNLDRCQTLRVRATCSHDSYLGLVLLVECAATSTRRGNSLTTRLEAKSGAGENYPA